MSFNKAASAVFIRKHGVKQSELDCSDKAIVLEWILSGSPEYNNMPDDEIERLYAETILDLHPIQQGET